MPTMEMKNPPIIRFPFLVHTTLLLIISSVTCRIHRGNETDKLALLALKAGITNDPHQVVSSWNPSKHFCHWLGITCGKKHQRVTRLDLGSIQLSGILSPHIGNLSFLQVLHFQNNSLAGHIPPEIGRLFRLQILRLQSNSFSGEIPRNISGCSNLLHLNFGSNTLVGRIPYELSLLSKLTFLSLGNNSFVGEILPSLANLTSLEAFSIPQNNFLGSIPDSFGRFKRLKILFLGGNNLSGHIPPSIFNISSIEGLSFIANRFRGSLPPDLGHRFPHIEILNLSMNQFHGPFPSSISNASNLLKFEIQNNQFIGKVPVLTNLYNLQLLLLSDNNFTDDEDLNFLFPLVNCSNLRRLTIDANDFGGILPEYISNFSTTLEVLIFGRNHIRGNIPKEIGNLINLKYLGMEQNHLTGVIPNSIGRLFKLQVLYLNENKLSGPIPDSMGNFSMLGELILLWNKLEGSIPKSLGQCQNLIQLHLNQNNLNGTIPKEIFISSLFALDLSENYLIGSIPVEVGKMINLNYLNFSINKLFEEIPASLGSCVHLDTLSLRGNLIQGTIPQSLRSLRGIQIFDLSQNNLFGKIPEYLESFQVLEYLNLSSNNFEGQLPIQGVFKNVSKFSVARNLKLCGGISELKLPKCKSNEPKKKLSHKLKVIIIIAASIIGLISILLCFVALFWSRKKTSVSTPTSLQPASGLQVSYHDLFKATNGFSSSNLIGQGGFGSVYKGILDEGETVAAVKVFNLEYRATFKSFKAECEALRNIRHRNLVKSLSVCSSIDSQGNDFLALVYEFMENCSLEDWLYPVDGGNQGYLKLMQRLNIAIEVANALEYLHNRCHVKIVHCDIKPSNILLDGDMIAHVGDFGLARFIPEASDRSSIKRPSTIGLKGSIGYVAPEYGMGSEVSSEGDVYSYGILVLEMFTGKRPSDDIFKDGLDLHNFALMGLSEGISKVVDPLILQMEEENHGDNIQNFLVSIIQIGVACSVSNPRERKDIGIVVAELSSIKRTFLRNTRTSRVCRNVVQRASIPPS